MSLSHLPPFLQSILVPIQNDEGRQGVILNKCEGSIPMVRKVARRQQGNRFFTHCHVAVSHLSHTAFLPRSEWRFRESASLTIGNGKRHPERMWRIYTRGGESGKKIKAVSVSCKLTILLRFKPLRQASILNRTTCASSFFWQPTPWSLYKTLRFHN